MRVKNKFIAVNDIFLYTRKGIEFLALSLLVTEKVINLNDYGAG